jgi:hypothetical protein
MLWRGRCDKLPGEARLRYPGAHVPAMEVESGNRYEDSLRGAECLDTQQNYIVTYFHIFVGWLGGVTTPLERRNLAVDQAQLL